MALNQFWPSSFIDATPIALRYPIPEHLRGITLHATSAGAIGIYSDNEYVDTIPSEVVRKATLAGDIGIKEMLETWLPRPPDERWTRETD